METEVIEEIESEKDEWRQEPLRAKVPIILTILKNRKKKLLKNTCIKNYIHKLFIHNNNEQRIFCALLDDIKWHRLPN